MIERGQVWVSAHHLGAIDREDAPPVDLSQYLALQPAWKADAACRDADLDDFFADEDETVRVGKALSLCQSCPVVEECLEHAMSTPGPTFGVWGNTTARQRRALRRRAKTEGDAA